MKSPPLNPGVSFNRVAVSAGYEPSAENVTGMPTAALIAASAAVRQPRIPGQRHTAAAAIAF
jgi:hypothetical protein